MGVVGFGQYNLASGELFDFVAKYSTKSDPYISFGYSNNPLASGNYATIIDEYGSVLKFFDSKFKLSSTTTPKEEWKKYMPKELMRYFAWLIYVPFVMAKLMKVLVGKELTGEFGVDKAGPKFMKVSENRSDGTYSMVFWRDRKKFSTNSYVRMVIMPVKFSIMQTYDANSVSEFFDKIKFRVQFYAQNGTKSSDHVSFSQMNTAWLNGHLQKCGRFQL